MTEDALPPEVTALLEAVPGTHMIEMLFPDMNGILRGKRVAREELAKLYTTGLNFPASTAILDVRGATFPALRYGTADGDPDAVVRAVPGSLAPVPWQAVPTAQVLVRMFEVSGEPYWADPRRVLERALEPLRELNLTPVVATELEFYLIEEGDAPLPKLARIPGTVLNQDGPQFASLEELADIDPFLAEVDAVCQVQNLPAGTAVSEFAPGQFEINLHHVDDPVLACDHAVLLKRAVKAIALKHGFAASFMAKPFPEYSGCGLHVHASLLDAKGRNVFSPQGAKADGGTALSEVLRHAVGGLTDMMGECMAIFAPNANSYRRLRPGTYVPLAPIWGINHRHLAVRIPLSDPANRRIETRVAGADANPYLVMAALMAGIHHGISDRCDPGPMVEEGTDAPKDVKLPTRWEAALDAYDASTLLPRYLGEDYWRVYGFARRRESETFHSEVSDRDYEWYLRLV